MSWTANWREAVSDVDGETEKLVGVNRWRRHHSMVNRVVAVFSVHRSNWVAVAVGGPIAQPSSRPINRHRLVELTLEAARPNTKRHVSWRPALIPPWPWLRWTIYTRQTQSRRCWLENPFT